MRCGVFVDTNLGINRSRSPDIDGVITMRRSGAGRGPNSEYLCRQDVCAKPPFLEADVDVF